MIPTDIAVEFIRTATVNIVLTWCAIAVCTSLLVVLVTCAVSLWERWR